LTSRGGEWVECAVKGCPGSLDSCTVTSMNARAVFPPLTKDELVSLQWISMVATRVVVPVAHIEKLLAAGYVEQSVSGLVLTDLGVLRLDREQAKKKPT
jgi:hypothetical protein